MTDSLTSKECCKHEEQALAWETVFGQLRKGNKKFYLGDGTGEQLAVREIERLQQRVDAARKILEPLHECDPDIREWLGMPRWDEGVIETRAAEPPNGNLLQQIAHWANQIPEAGPIRALLAETKDESLPEIEQLGTVTMKCKPATKLEPLPPVETPESMPIDQFVAELEKDPEWKEALDEARRDR